MTDAEVEDWIGSLPPAPGIRSIEDADPEEDARLDADIAAGRGIPHELVRAWLLTWGTSEYKPMPREWLE